MYVYTKKLMVKNNGKWGEVIEAHAVAEEGP